MLQYKAEEPKPNHFVIVHSCWRRQNQNLESIRHLLLLLASCPLVLTSGYAVHSLGLIPYISSWSAGTPYLQCTMNCFCVEMSVWSECLYWLHTCKWHPVSNIKSSYRDKDLNLWRLCVSCCTVQCQYIHYLFTVQIHLVYVGVHTLWIKVTLNDTGGKPPILTQTAVLVMQGILHSVY